MTARTDVFTRVCIVATLVLLALIAARPLLQASVTRADAATQYKTEIIDQGFVATDDAAAKIIQQRSHEGWQLVTATVYYREYGNAVGPRYLLVFRK